jgi:hypothetical protein
MDKIWMVRAYFEEYDSSSWKILGLFTDKSVAEDVEKKWSDFYLEKAQIFDEPKNWKPEEDDDAEWTWSDEYFRLEAKYRDIKNFKGIEVEEYPLNQDMSLTYSDMNDDLISLMVQWDRNHKLEKIIK